MAKPLSAIRRGLTWAVLLLVVPVQATTVHDPVNFVVNVLNKMENTVSAMQQKVMNQQIAVQIKNQLEQIHQLQQEYQKLQEVQSALAGRSGYGRYLEGPFVMLDPDQSPENLDDVMYHMRDVGRGEEGDTDFEKQAAAYQRANPYVDLGNWQPTTDQGITRREMEHQRETSLALGAASRQAYNQSSNHYRNLDMLRREIDKTDTVKQSVDLTNRLLIEIVAVQSEQLRMLALQSQSQAQQRQQNYNEKARTLRGADTYQPTVWEEVK